MPRKRKSKKHQQTADPISLLLGALIDVFTKLIGWMVTVPIYFLSRKIGRFLRRTLSPSLGTQCETTFGLKVKSFTERRIAEFLNQHDIIFMYEQPVRVWFFKTIKPDFYLPQYNLYIEYDGLLNHSTKGKQYQQGVKYKKERLEALGITCVHLNQSHKKDLESHLRNIIFKQNFNSYR